jgi:hypothetical protein
MARVPTTEPPSVSNARAEKSQQWSTLNATLPRRLIGKAELLHELKRCAEVYRHEIALERRQQHERERNRRLYATVARALERVEESLDMLERAQRALLLPGSEGGLSALRRAHAQELAQFAALRPRERLRPAAARSADYRLLLVLADCWTHYLQAEASGPDWQQFARCALIACGSHSELAENRRHLQAAADRTRLNNGDGSAARGSTSQPSATIDGSS